MSRAQTGRHVRQRKLNTKQALRIVREGDLEDDFDEEAQRHIPQVETGVEKGEEIVSTLTLQHIQNTHLPAPGIPFASRHQRRECCSSWSRS